MAKYESRLAGDFDKILDDINTAVTTGSASASLEESSNFIADGGRCAVRVYERYSWSGGNRVSLNVTLFEANSQIFVTAIASGGSQAMFFKVNTFGEESFLKTLVSVLERYSIK